MGVTKMVLALINLGLFALLMYLVVYKKGQYAMALIVVMFVYAAATGQMGTDSDC